MRNSWLPTRKGTELNPQVMQSPAKLVIRGVPPGSPLFQAVAQLFAGRMRTFHVKQQQNYSLNEVQYQRGQIDWGDGRARYTNIQGQEILELEVSVPVLKELEHVLQSQEKIIVPHKYILVEFELTDVASGLLISPAIWLRKPKLSPYRGLSVTGSTPVTFFPGFASSDNTVLLTQNQAVPPDYEVVGHAPQGTVQYPYESDGVDPLALGSEIQTPLRTNFLVYLPKLGVSDVEIDIYAWLTADLSHSVKFTAVASDQPSWGWLNRNSGEFDEMPYWKPTDGEVSGTKMTRMIDVPFYAVGDVPLVPVSSTGDAAYIDWPYIGTLTYNGKADVFGWKQVAQTWD